MEYPRIIQFCPYYPPHVGGIEMYVSEFAHEYRKQCPLSRVVTYGLHEEQDFFDDGVEIFYLPAFEVIPLVPFPKIWLPRFWRQIGKIWRLQADLVISHTRFFSMSGIAGVYARFRGFTWFHIEHGSGFVVSQKWYVSFLSRLVDHTFGRLIIAYADHVITVSGASEKFVAHTFSPRSLVTVYRGFREVSHIGSRSYGSKIICTYIGRLVTLKGVDILLHALAGSTLLPKNDIELHIIGEGPELDHLEKLTKTLRLERSVFFRGPKTNQEIRETILPSTHIFINPSYQEGFPTTVVEAGLAGCYVIATDVGGTSEIGKFFDIHLVPPGNVISLSRALGEGYKLIKGDQRNTSNISHPTELSWQFVFSKINEKYCLLAPNNSTTGKQPL